MKHFLQEASSSRLGLNKHEMKFGGQGAAFLSLPELGKHCKSIKCWRHVIHIQSGLVGWREAASLGSNGSRGNQLAEMFC
jgi:hypothetical protein